MNRPLEPRRRLVLGAAAVGLSAIACRTPLPEVRPSPAAVTPAEATRFRLEGPEHEMEPSPLDIVGSAPEGISSELPIRSRPTEPRAPGNPEGLRVEDVLVSVEQNFPLILAALDTLEVAEGKLIAAQGGFDLRLSAKAGAELEGFYENERANVTLEQPTMLWGTSLIGGYRIGRGDFADYDGKAKTLTDGEVRGGVSVPLLQGGRIDERRVTLWQARMQREQALPLVLQKRLEATRKAVKSYWKWVSAGQKYEVARRLLALAENRQEAVTLAVQEGELREIALVENRRLIVEREAILFGAERELQAASIALSLYLRDDAGVPVVPGQELLPLEFPMPRDPELVVLDDDVQTALARRPELRVLELERSQADLDIDLASNQLLPKLDLGVLASQDIGDQVSTPDDKEPFELEATLRFELPVQQRKARGSGRAAQARRSKLERELQFLRDQVSIEVQDAASALRQSYLRVERVIENLELAGRLEEAERLLLREGQSDLLRVNLREQQTAAAAGSMIDVLAEHFRSLADYRAVLGLPYDEVLEGRAVGGGPLE